MCVWGETSVCFLGNISPTEQPKHSRQGSGARLPAASCSWDAELVVAASPQQGATPDKPSLQNTGLLLTSCQKPDSHSENSQWFSQWILASYKKRVPFTLSVNNPSLGRARIISLTLSLAHLSRGSQGQAWWFRPGLHQLVLIAARTPTGKISGKLT